MYEREEDDDEEAWLQLRPVEPLPSQCCGGGCSPCVFDLYHRDLARWEAARASKDRSLLGGEESQNCPSHLSPETFLAFRISAMDRLTKDTYRVRFALPRNSQLGLRPGQHLILRGIVNDLEVQRAYTPISPANAEGYFEVLIKCYQTGLMSQYVESWRAGDTAFWRGPFGGFFYQPNQLMFITKKVSSYRGKKRIIKSTCGPSTHTYQSYHLGVYPSKSSFTHGGIYKHACTHVCGYNNNVRHTRGTSCVPGSDFCTCHEVTHLILTTALRNCYPRFTDMWCARVNTLLQHPPSTGHAEP
ncbi:NADH-cytochrome b5 reductase-like isoform X9 [Equus przewalskii]|uniref:NADH-cytochrome b5 reductase-like isoform X9 n=1 Tax=Equus przewalskii TaxID=9798 RepID=A0ABM2FG24_EQUPR